MSTSTSGGGRRRVAGLPEGFDERVCYHYDVESKVFDRQAKRRVDDIHPVFATRTPADRNIKVYVAFGPRGRSVFIGGFDEDAYRLTDMVTAIIVYRYELDDRGAVIEATREKVIDYQGGAGNDGVDYLIDMQYVPETDQLVLAFGPEITYDYFVARDRARSELTQEQLLLRFRPSFSAAEMEHAFDDTSYVMVDSARPEDAPESYAYNPKLTRAGRLLDPFLDESWRLKDVLPDQDEMPAKQFWFGEDDREVIVEQDIWREDEGTDRRVYVARQDGEPLDFPTAVIDNSEYESPNWLLRHTYRMKHVFFFRAVSGELIGVDTNLDDNAIVVSEYGERGAYGGSIVLYDPIESDRSGRHRSTRRVRAFAYDRAHDALWVVEKDWVYAYSMATLMHPVRPLHVDRQLIAPRPTINRQARTLLMLRSLTEAPVSALPNELMFEIFKYL